MNEYTRAGIILFAYCTALCGAVIVATDPLRRHREGLERLFSFNQQRRTP